MKKLLVLDVMPILYRGHFALLSRPRLTASGFNTSALFVFTNIVREMATAHGATHIALAMDTSPTFRHERYPGYKAQRESLPEDIAASIAPAEEFAQALRIPFLRIPGFEADDIMGTLAARAEAQDFTTWLVSPDKDIAQLVTEKTLLCRPAKAGSGAPEFYDTARVCEEWGLSSPSQMIDYLGMAGDASDNIPGFPGIGPKTAARLLREYGSMEGVIAHASELKGKLAESVADHVEQGRLSRDLAAIRRDVPIALTLDELELREPDFNALEAFCRRYELSKLWQAYSGKAEPLRGKTSPAAEPESAAESAEPALPLASLADFPHQYCCVTTGSQLRELAAELSASPQFAFDTETMGLNPRWDAAVGLSFSTRPGRAWYIPLAAPHASPPDTKPVPQEQDLFSFAGSEPPPQSPPAQPQQLDLFAFEESAPVTAAPEKAPASLLSAVEIRAALAPVFANPSIRKIAHNAKFDLHVLRALGIEVAPPIADSMLAHYVMDPASRHSMNALSREFLHYDPISIENLIGPHGKNQRTMNEVELPVITDYAAEDADVTLRLHEVLAPRVREAGAWRAYEEAELPLLPVLVDMESTGVRIDTAALSQYSFELGKELSSIEERVREFAGEAFNLDSNQQLSRILFEKLALPHAGRTATGHYSTAEEVLQGIKNAHPIIPAILDYRACAKLKSTYVDKLPQCIDPKDGRVHTTFLQALTETGRLSSEAPNLQNIPIRTERGKRIRAAFIASSPDHVLVSADYSQIELRMMAHLSGDEAMRDAFLRDADIHRETAARVFGIAPEEVSREQRSFCKQVNFGIIYGISAFGLSQRVGCSRTEAQEIIQSYFKMFPKIRMFMDQTIESAREKGYVTTLLGRRRPLRDISSRNHTVRAGAERNAINTPVQGSAADLVKLAMVRVHTALKKEALAARLVLQIHDELLLDVPRSETGRIQPLLRDAMENALPLSVPLRTDIGIGDNWLAAH